MNRQERIARRNQMRREAAPVPAPFQDGDIAEFMEDIQQLTDSKLFDLMDMLEKAEKSRSTEHPNMFQQGVSTIGGSYTTTPSAQKYAKDVADAIRKKIEGPGTYFYFSRFKRGQKVMIKPGVNRGDVILYEPSGKVISAMPSDIVKFLKKV